MNPKITNIAFKVVLGIVAVLLVFFVPAHLNPIITDATLSPGGEGQSGWPLPFAASFWDDSVMNAHQAQRFNIIYFVLDVTFVYLSLLVLEYILRHTLSLAFRGRYSEEIGVKVRTYTQITLMLGLLTFLMYWGLILYIFSPKIHTGVTEDTMPKIMDSEITGQREMAEKWGQS